MQVTVETIEDRTIIKVDGRVDAMTTQDLQDVIMNTFQSCSKIELDFAQVEYISSAGLKTLLLGQKTANSKGGQFTLRHVNDMVMEVLNMTGFASILHIED
ncbi:MAG: anti-sigma factor antagonist [Lachnospiraceae bacterium]|nr:anti-sigma factor antagonist [Lachnospiraceae bacterium]